MTTNTATAGYDNVVRWMDRIGASRRSDAEVERIGYRRCDQLTNNHCEEDAITMIDTYVCMSLILRGMPIDTDRRANLLDELIELYRACADTQALLAAAPVSGAAVTYREEAKRSLDIALSRLIRRTVTRRLGAELADGGIVDLTRN